MILFEATEVIVVILPRVLIPDGFSNFVSPLIWRPFGEIKLKNVCLILILWSCLLVATRPSFSAEFCDDQFQNRTAMPYKIEGWDRYLELLNKVDFRPQHWMRVLTITSSAYDGEFAKIKDLVDNGKLEFYNPASHYHPYNLQGVEDIGRIKLHAATVAMTISDRSEVRATTAMVYNLHLLDDAVDDIVITYGKRQLLPELCTSHDDIKRIFFEPDKLTDKRYLRIQFPHLTTIISMMIGVLENRFLLRPENLQSRQQGLIDSIFLLLNASWVSTGSQALRVASMTNVKSEVLARLSPSVQNAFEQYSARVFFLTAKAPMGALFSLEGQMYNYDLVFLWSLIFSPFLYNFAKDQQLSPDIAHPPESRIDHYEIFSALLTAVTLLKTVPDNLHDLRINQLKFMLVNWPHNIPKELSVFYENLTNRENMRE